MTAIVLAMLVVLAAWTLVFLAMRHWGPGWARRRVHCPKWGVNADVVVEQGEGDFGRLRAKDVAACSLLAGKPVNCEKDCLDWL